jgi:hypothetical protein
MSDIIPTGVKDDDGNPIFIRKATTGEIGLVVFEKNVLNKGFYWKINDTGKLIEALKKIV